MNCYAVIDTNVLVSALLSLRDDAATVQIIRLVMEGEIIPLYSEKILDEYWEVLRREKFSFAETDIRKLLESIAKYGISVEPESIQEVLSDIKDLPFYEVVMEKRADDTYLITGNLKHFPKRTYIVTPRQMLDILDGLKSNHKEIIHSNLNNQI